MTEIKKTSIPQRLKNVSSDHPYVAGAVDIVDDVDGRSQQEINADTYRKDETYSKEQLNSMITTPEQKYENYTATAETTAISDLLPEEGEPDTTYRVGCWDGTEYNASKFSEYSWDGTQYILLSVQSPGIDEEPTAGSSNLAESGGVFAAFNPDINYTEHKYLGKDGNLYDTENAFSVSDYYFVVPGLKIVNSRANNAVSCDYTFLCFYDINKNFISRLRRDSESTQSTDYTLLAGDIPANAVYFRASVEYGNNNTRIEIPYKNAALVIDKEISELKVPVHFETENAYLSEYGKVVTTSATTFYTTLPIMAKAGIVLHNCHAASSAENTFAAFYDVSGNFVGALTNSSSSAFDYTVQAADIPDNAVYMRATMYSNGYVSGYSYYADAVKLKKITGDITNLSSVPVGKTSGCYLKSDGGLSSVDLATFCVTDYCPVKAGIDIIKAHRASTEDAENTFLCFYDSGYNFISNVTSDTATINYTLTDIPEGAAYFRATVWDDGYVNYRIPVSQLIKTKGGGFTKMFDYGTALGMDKDTLINSVESASNGRCTVIYDDYGYPSLMYKIPKVSIGALAPALGELTDVHPAFVVNSVEKDCIYISVFLASEYNGHLVSWFGLQPKGRVTLPNLRSGISGKGNGWHLETIYERSLVALLTMNLNSPTPTGNTNNGMSHLKPWEYCQHVNGSLPGTALPSRTGIEWINGTQPSTWSHNKELWGIQDVIGGYHRICDLMKVVNGKIYLAGDNKFFKKGDASATFEDDWIDTGAAFDYINNNIVLNTSVTNPMSADTYVEKSYQQIGCTTGYDALSASIRKKLCLLLLAPRLTSDADTILNIGGLVGVNNNKELCYGVFGGAQEYSGSGLGSQITAYPIDDNETSGHNAHYNMGSRIVYIP